MLPPEKYYLEWKYYTRNTYGLIKLVTKRPRKCDKSLIYDKTAYVQSNILPQIPIILHGKCPCVRDKFHVCRTPALQSLRWVSLSPVGAWTAAHYQFDCLTLNILLLDPCPTLATISVPCWPTALPAFISGYTSAANRLGKYHHPHHPGWCNIFWVWNIWRLVVNFIFRKIFAFFGGKSAGKLREY